MTGSISGANSSVPSAALFTRPTQPDPIKHAEAMIANNQSAGQGIHYGALLKEIDQLIAKDPILGAQVEEAVKAQLGVNGTKRLMAASYTIGTGDKALTMSRNAPSIEQYYKGTAHAKHAKTPEEKVAYAKSDKAHYAKLDKIFGDGNAKTFEGGKIEQGIGDMLRRGFTVNQTAEYKAVLIAEAKAAEKTTQKTQELVADLGQMALDIVGIFDPTPTADLVNAGISAWRGDGWGAFLSVISAVPYVGDLAKLGKLGKWAETVAKAVDTVANNPAMRKALEPALRKISDLIGALPAKAFDALPDSAKAVLLDIKSKIDDVLGKAGATADNVAAAAVRTVERTFGKNSVEWVTDAQGRLVSASATLREVFPGLTRSGDEVAAQGRAAERGIAGDHGGHAVPHRFMGDQGDINLFPQNGVAVGAAKNFNGSAFKTLENELADWVQAGGTVKYDVKFSDFVGDRPGTVEISYKVFGKNGKEVFRNDDLFDNAAGQTFDRLSKSNIIEKLKAAEQ